MGCPSDSFESGHDTTPLSDMCEYDLLYSTYLECYVKSQHEREGSLNGVPFPNEGEVIDYPKERG
jgi:hypothetical protein